MSAVYSPNPALPTVSRGGNGSSTAPAAPRLRDSCHACASSKVKCHREKPTCSRCAKRGLTCEYVATKRGGRKQDCQSGSSDGSSNTSPSITAAIEVAQALPPESNWFTADTTISSTNRPVTCWSAPSSTVSTSDSLPLPVGLDSSSVRSASGASSDLFSNLLSPVDQSMSSAVTSLMTDLDDFFGTPMSFSVSDTFDTNILDQGHFLPSSLDGSSKGTGTFLDNLLEFENAVSELPVLSGSPSSRPGDGFFTFETQNYQNFRADDSRCPCLIQALGLMKQLFLESSADCTISRIQSLVEPSQVPTFQDVIAKNKTTIEGISTMLQCPCSQDDYLLAIMSLIIFKVLGWHAAAAHSTLASNDFNDISHSRHSLHSERVIQDSAVVSRDCLDKEDSARMTAQLVLNELHRVQRLVNQLSSKLKAQTMKDSRLADQPNNDPGTGNADKETASPLSSLMLSQLELDLRNQLKALSLKIVETLRRE